MHGVSGQLNVFVLDVDSVVTSYGEHNRLCVFLPRGGEVYIREDLHGLPESTEAQRRTVALKDQSVDLRRMTYVGGERWESRAGESIDHTYRIN